MTAAHAAAEQQEEEEQHDSNQQAAATFLRLIAISVPVVAGLLYLGTVSRRSAEPSRTPELAPAAATAPQAPQASSGAPTPSLGGQPATSEVPAASAGSSPAAPERVRPSPGARAGPSGGSAAEPGRVESSEQPGSRAQSIRAGNRRGRGHWSMLGVGNRGRRTRRRARFQTGERIAFEFGQSVVLTAGDAAALAVTINGEDARPLGSAGQVVTVRVTPTNFKGYLATP